MEISSFTARDWVLFLGSYVLWYPLAVLIWRCSRKRIKTMAFRAMVFGVVFAPGVVPIVREAYVIAPAILAFAFVGTFAAFEGRTALDLVEQVLPLTLGSMFVLSCIYGVAIHLRRSR